ncbi:putative deoxyribonuclease RhsC [Posidoniimonas polymericola]|uniref:Putative deoxyribonuclease RhsC n=1 Tax=Posidoniimonas polymericola TaxID=2528002 RepID=A0A5C5XTZ1_9BACT|nr:putative deoxyribonuclease RhsC [Posidoniimonas polymericola]
MGRDINNEHLYTGRRTDTETGLQLNRRRFYHQQLGRWVSRDPIGYAAGDMNLYGYVGGNPVLYADSHGLQRPPGLGLPIDAGDLHDIINDKIDGAPGVSEPEKDWCKCNTTCCFQASDSREQVADEMNERYGGGSGNSAVHNAIQHCAWMCIVASKWGCSKEQARELGQAHEDGNFFGGANGDMDLWNNDEGIESSSNWDSVDSCFDKCEAKAKSGELDWFEPIDTPARPGQPPLRPGGLPTGPSPPGRPVGPRPPHSWGH